MRPRTSEAWVADCHVTAFATGTIVTKTAWRPLPWAGTVAGTATTEEATGATGTTTAAMEARLRAAVEATPGGDTLIAGMVAAVTEGMMAAPPHAVAMAIIRRVVPRLPTMGEGATER